MRTSGDSATGRRIEKPVDSLNRLYVVESLMTLTGQLADHRLRMSSGHGGRDCGGDYFSAIAGKGGQDRWVAECAKDLVANAGASLVVAGYRQPLAVHVLAHAMNAALKNIGKTVVFHEAPDLGEGRIDELAQSSTRARWTPLSSLEPTRLTTRPVELDWAAAQAKAKSVVRLGYYEDETFEATKRDSDWHLPMAHYLESWGDALDQDGTRVSIQPLIAPLFGGLTEIELLARIAGETVTRPHEIVRRKFWRIE